MAQKGYVSEFMSGGRIVSKGKITDLSKGFKLSDGTPFSVYLRPKTGITDIDTTLSVKLYQEEEVSEAPVVYNDWSPLAITEIAPDNDVLKRCDIYWGSGSYTGGV